MVVAAQAMAMAMAAVVAPEEAATGWEAATGSKMVAAVRHARVAAPIWRVTKAAAEVKAALAAFALACDQSSLPA